MEERKEFVTRYYGDSPEYRASIDWSRRPGPVATYRKELHEEMQKAENGGPGAEDEEVIRPEDSEAIDLPSEVPGQEAPEAPMPEGESQPTPTPPVPMDMPPPAVPTPEINP
jgi:general secretion pathway protein D